MTMPVPPRVALAAALAPCALTALPPAAASEPSWWAEGELTFHDEPDWDATIDVADCTFWLRGTGVEIPNGTVEVYEDHGRGGAVLLMSVAFEGTPNEDGGYDFLVGPLTVETDPEGTGLEVFAEIVVIPESEDDIGRFLQSDEVTIHCGGKFIPCIDDLSAEALDDGDVRLTWSAAANATHYFVYRTDGDQLPNGQTDWDFLANVTATEYVDLTAEAGVTYAYEVVSSDGALAMNGSCPVVEVTAVPFFGAPLLGAVAAVGAVGAYAWMRRR